MQVHLLHLGFAALATLAAATSSILDSPIPPIVETNKTLGRRWTNSVTDLQSAAKRWPRGGDHYTRISYCYPTPDHRNQLYNLVQGAISLWTSILGAAGPANRHSIVIAEHPQAYCYYARDPKDPNAAWVWNKNVPEDTLMIMVDQRVSAASTTPGWHDGSQETNSGEATAGRHRMKINNALAHWYSQRHSKNFRIAKAAIAHEFGHVFGLEHEHQRDDRDRYIFFDCTGLSGYAAAYTKVQAARQGGSTDSMSSACTFPTVASKYGFNEIEAYNNLNSFRVNQNVAYEVRRSHGTVYDYNSIMHYSSDMGAVYYKENDLANARVPIRRWINSGPDYQPPQQATARNSVLIPMNERPSNLDILAVKAIYSWSERHLEESS